MNLNDFLISTYKMAKKTLILFLLSAVILFAQDGGNTGLSFLKIGSDARSIGGSDIGFLDSKLSSVYYNPAALTLQNTESVMFTHQSWIQDLNSEIINANFFMFGLPFAIGVNTTKISGFEVRTNPTSSPDAVFNANYFYANLSTGFNLIDNFDFGFSIKYLYESLLTDDASGTGYDIGLMYRELIDNMNVGVSVRNMGSMKALRNEKTKLPTDLILNASYTYKLQNTKFRFLPVLGLQKFLEQDDMHFHLGTEVNYDEQFSLRVGYITGYESKGLTIGAGVYWAGFNLDYAYTPFSFGIGNANTISLMYSF